jgi:hypothetical protein
MRKQITKAKLFALAIAVAGLATFGFASGASAHTGLFSKFNYCPSTNPTVFKCLNSKTTGGKVVLGKKTVPIVNPVTLQGGFTEAEELPHEEYISKFVAATNGETLSKAPQPVPGGLSGLVNCKEISLSWLRVSCEAIFENGLTGVNATLELAKPASEIRVSQVNLAFEEKTALYLPVKVHLENPLLGSGCYIGSSSSPLTWHLTTGNTTPPVGTAPIRGKGGTGKLVENSEILEIQGNELVDNAWSAPGANGCGGFLVEYILDPIINSSVGVPAVAGKNAAVLQNTIWLANAEAVNEN